MTASSHKLVFPNRRGEELAGRLELPTGHARAFGIFAHCFTCSKDAAAATRISRALCRHGLAILRFDFTGLGNSEGDFANTSFSSNVQDLIAAADYLRREHRAPRLLIGHSLGGAAVLSAAAEIPEASAVVTLAAPSEPAHLEHLVPPGTSAAAELELSGRALVDIGGRTFPITREFLADLNEHRIRERLARLDAALLVLHSPQDTVVDLDHARRIYAAARQPKSFITLDGADHLLGKREDAEYVGEVVAAWSSRYLPNERPEREGEGEAPGTVTVVEQERGFAQEITAGPHRLTADEPEALGGTDTGPTPYDLLLAALGACTSMTLRMYARHKGLPLEGVAVRLRHARVHAADCASCEDDGSRVDRIEREIEVRGPLSQEQRERMLEIAERCPVHRTLMGQKEVVSRLVEDLA